MLVTQKQWAIFAHYTFLFSIVFSFDIYLRQNTRISLLGTFDPRHIPKHLAWILALGIIGSFVLLLYPIVFLLYPQLVQPTLLFQSRPLEVTGLLLMISGAIVDLIAIIQVGASYLLAGQDARLITTGAYGLVRNPVYVGASLSFLGIFLLLPTGVYLLCFFLYLLSNHVRVLREEEFLRKRFGQEYERYCQSVGRYWPGIRR